MDANYFLSVNCFTETQLGMTISLLINIKMLTSFGIFMFISREHFTVSRIKPGKVVYPLGQSVSIALMSFIYGN